MGKSVIRQVDPAIASTAVTPSNTADLPHVTRRLWVGTAGDLYIDMLDNKNLDSTGTPVTLTAATGTFTMSGTNDTDVDHVFVGGTSIAFTAGATDTLSATAAKNAINANSTVNAIVLATSALGVVTVTSKVLGKFGNSITTTATGTGVTAGQATLAGATGGAGNYLKYKVPIGRQDLAVTRIYATGTTATDINAEW